MQTLNTHLSPTYCTSHAVPENPSHSIYTPRYDFSEGSTHLWQIYVRDNHAVQGTRGIFRLSIGIATGVVLVFEIRTVLIPALGAHDLPWRAVLGHADRLFG